MKMKRLLAAALSVLMLSGLAACGNNGGKDGGKGKTDGVTEVSIPSFKSGENVGAIFFLPQVERFNEKYKDKYKLTIEEVPQASYNDKLKQLAQQKKLPVIMHAGDEDWFKNVAIPQEYFYDLSDWVAKTPAVKDILIEESLAFCTTEDGKLTQLPLFLIKPTGFFYNETLLPLEKAPSEMSMDEFLSTLGDNKIAFQTADNGWTTALLYTALIANEEGGADILREYPDTKLDDFSQPAIINATAKLYDLFQSNASANSIGAAYADAANAFMSNNAAVIANGPWMSADFEEEDKWSNDFKGSMVRGALYPGNYGICRPGNYGEFWLAANASEEELELALAFFEFICSPEEIEAYALAEGAVNPKVQFSDNFDTELANTPVLKDLADATTVDSQYIPNVLDIMPASVAETEFGKLLPKLADGTLSPEEFCSQLSQKSAEAKS